MTKESGFWTEEESGALEGEPGLVGREGDGEGREVRLDIKDAESGSIAEAMVVERLIAYIQQGKEGLYLCTGHFTEDSGARDGYTECSQRKSQDRH